MFWPPCGASSSAFGAPDTLVARRAIREVELREARMKRDQHRVSGFNAIVSRTT